MDIIKKPFIFQVCGYKNTGKTTFLSKLIRYFREQNKNLKIATIKHDGHDFDTAHYTEDNFLHFNSGGNASVVYSNNKILKIEEKRVQLEEILKEFQDYDVIFIEGCKNSDFLKVEILREGISEVPVSNPKNRMGVLSNFSLNLENFEEKIYLDELELLKEIYCKYAKLSKIF